MVAPAAKRQAVAHLVAGHGMAERRAQRFLDLSQSLTPDALARLCAQGELDLTSYTEARRLALPQAEVLVQALRDGVASISSQSELAQNLIDNEITGPAYLAEIAEEADAPLLMLSPPASKR